MEIILGSTSKRRREFISNFALAVTLDAPDFDEASVPFQEDPAAYVVEIAKGKALSLKNKYPEALILTCDTIAYQEGRVFEKPDSEAAAIESLSALSGQWHTVYSGMVALKKGQMESGFEETRVLFRHLTEDMIRHYIESIHAYDKAGGYAIQGAAELIVEKLEGSYSNVVGLPLNLLYNLLALHNVDLWSHLPK